MIPQVVRQHVLEPILDARALNLTQDQLLANPTVEIDSVVEHLAALKRTAVTPAQHQHIDALAVLVDQLMRSNHAEGLLEQDVASVADRLALQSAGSSWGAKRCARELRPALADLCNPVITGTRRRDRLDQVRGVAAAVPVAVLLSGTVRHELGERKFAILAEIVERVAA